MAPILVSVFVAILAAIVSALLAFAASAYFVLGDFGIALTFYLAPIAGALIAFVFTLHRLRAKQ